MILKKLFNAVSQIPQKSQKSNNEQTKNTVVLWQPSALPAVCVHLYCFACSFSLS